MSIVMSKVDLHRIARKLLESVREERLAEVEVALSGLVVATNRALEYPEGAAVAGVRAALEQPAVARELTPLVEAIAWTR